MSYRVKKIICIRKFLNKLLSNQVIKKIKILKNNKTSFTLIKNLKSQNQIKYIDMIHHYI